MTATEINFDGLIGPMHNYAGLSPGNIASATNAGAISQPRAAAPVLRHTARGPLVASLAH